MLGEVSDKGASGLRKGVERRLGWRVVVRCVAVSAACFVFAAACSEASPAPPQSGTGSGMVEEGPTVPGELVVRFEGGLSEDEQLRFLEARGLGITRRHFSP